MRFVCVDVEIANPDYSTVCAIGVATYEDGIVVDEWYSLIDPQDSFGAYQTTIHGLDHAKVQGAPTFSEASPILNRRLSGEVVVSHSPFDQQAIGQAAQRWQVPAPDCRWLDSAAVARRAWPELADHGYGLKSLCNWIGYEFDHHDALADAKAAGQVVLAAMAASDLDLDDLTAAARRTPRVSRPTGSPPITDANRPRDRTSDTSLLGETVVFTGRLGIARADATDLATHAGAAVKQGVSNRITLLVVGDLDIRERSDAEKSSKHRKAEQLIANGAPIRIMGETEFRSLVSVPEAAARPSGEPQATSGPHGFVAIQVALANPTPSSICAIGVARYEDGDVVDEWYSLIDPQDSFAGGYWGVDADDVYGAPTFAEVSPTLNRLLNGAVVVSHMHFARIGIQQASERWQVPAPDCRWLDVATVARRTWPDVAERGWGLEALCARVGFDYDDQFDPVAAKAAGQVLLAAMADSGLDLDAIATLAGKSRPKAAQQWTRDGTYKYQSRDGNPDGHLVGEIIVFSGGLGMPRTEAAELAAQAGCVVKTTVSTRTTLLVVGDAAVSEESDANKSSKHRKAEQLIADGAALRIISVTEFRSMLSTP